MLAWFIVPVSAALAAQPVIISPLPANGISPSAPIVFVFSQQMNTNVSGVDFVDFMTFSNLTAVSVWSSNNTALTCTPMPAFPANRQIVWSAYGENLASESLGDPTGGFFMTGSGGGGGGFGTNAFTTFSVGKIHHYNQTSSNGTVLDPATPYGFSGATMLASNRNPSAITLTLPTTAVSNMIQVPLQPEIYLVIGIATNLNAYNSNFPSGNYTFMVTESPSNQTVVVNLPDTNVIAQPVPPKLTNFPATQMVNPFQDFVLGWDAFVGNTTNVYVDVDIGTVYLSPEPGRPGALGATNRTFTIPAGTLLPNSNYFSRVGFFHHVSFTNAGYVTEAYRATYTEFTLYTSSGGQLRLTNALWASNVFSFDVVSSNVPTVTVEYTSVLPATNWTSLLTTNNPGAQFHVISTQAVSNPNLFYRAREGP